MSLIISSSMYFLSFLPLWITVVFIDAKSLAEGGGNKCTEIIGISLILVGIIISLIILFVKFYGTCDEKYTYTIETAKESKMITAEFLLAYILPLFAFDFTLWDEVVKFLIFFLIFGFLCIRHSYFSVNIVLELMHYRMYECCLRNDDGIGIEKTVISQERLNMQKGQRVSVKIINNEFFLDTNK